MITELAVLVVAALHLSQGHPRTSPEWKLDDDVSRFFSSRIVGGVDAPDGVAAHMVALVGGGPVLSFLSCGGSVIGRRHVLSAAHCIEPYVVWGELSKELFGVVGSKYWNSTENVIRFSGYKNHPGWDWGSIKNDIGVLITTAAIQYSDRVRPISLSFAPVAGRQDGFVTGWGRLKVGGNIPWRLQYLDVTTLPPLECSIRVLWKSIVWGPAPPVDPELEICTLVSKGRGMCNGDSGSALVLKESHQQVGIVSWGFPCALGAPDVFVRISAYKDWISSVTGKHI